MNIENFENGNEGATDYLAQQVEEAFERSLGNMDIQEAPSMSDDVVNPERVNAYESLQQWQEQNRGEKGGLGKLRRTNQEKNTWMLSIEEVFERRNRLGML